MRITLFFLPSSSCPVSSRATSPADWSTTGLGTGPTNSCFPRRWRNIRRTVPKLWLSPGLGKPPTRQMNARPSIRVEPAQKHHQRSEAERRMRRRSRARSLAKTLSSRRLDQAPAPVQAPPPEPARGRRRPVNLNPLKVAHNSGISRLTASQNVCGRRSNFSVRRATVSTHLISVCIITILYVVMIYHCIFCTSLTIAFS